VRISNAAHGLVFTLAVTLALVISVNHLNTYAEPEATMEICINGKCKMVSDHDGYHSQKTCINNECSTDMLRSNSTDKLNYMTNNYHLLNPTDGNYRNEYP